MSRPGAPWDWLGLTAGAVLLVSAALPVSRLPGVPLCLFYAHTGLPCAGCGLTRAFCSISHGAFTAAWGYHPFSFALYAGFVAALALPLLRRRWPVATQRVLASRWLWGAGGACGGAMLLFGVVRALRAALGAP